VTTADEESSDRAEVAVDALLLTAEAHMISLETCSLQKDVEVCAALNDQAERPISSLETNALQRTSYDGRRQT